MSCPLCGDVCRCSYAAPAAGDARPRDLADDRLADEFPSSDIDGDEAPGGRASVLIDPEAWDDSEEQFAASVAEAAAIVAQRKPRVNAARVGANAAPAQLDFDVPDSSSRDAASRVSETLPDAATTTLTGIERVAEQIAGSVAPVEADEAGWRNEVASRVHSYRARRRRGHPEGALSLDFEPPAAPTASPHADALQRVFTRYSLLASTDVLLQPPAALPDPEPPVAPPAVENNLIEFPRLACLPAVLEELAEPLPETPRILDAPESEELPPVMPTVAAITLEGEAESEDFDPQPQPDVPMRVAAVGSRLFAALIDGLVVMLAAAIFVIIVLQMAGPMPLSRLALPIAGLVVAALWALYQYMFLTHAGRTPGLDLARLELCDFSGQPLPRATRRARAVFLLVSAMPLGLGFIWSLLDEDTLCWHDRITRSCIVER